MEKSIRYTLGKNERLKSRKAIDNLFKKGSSFSVPMLRIAWQVQREEQTALPLQAAFSVSKRYFKKATDRNRVKRLMREAYRLQKIPLQEQLKEQSAQLQAFFMFTGRAVPEWEAIQHSFSRILKQLQKNIREKAADHP